MSRLFHMSRTADPFFLQGALARAATYFPTILQAPVATQVGHYHRRAWAQGWEACQTALAAGYTVIHPQMSLPVTCGALCTSSAHPRLAWITVRDAHGHEFVVRQISRCLLHTAAAATIDRDTADAINQAHAVAAQRMVTMAMRSTREQRATMGG